MSETPSVVKTPSRDQSAALNSNRPVRRSEGPTVGNGDSESSEGEAFRQMQLKNDLRYYSKCDIGATLRGFQAGAPVPGVQPVADGPRAREPG